MAYRLGGNQNSDFYTPEQLGQKQAKDKANDIAANDPSGGKLPEYQNSEGTAGFSTVFQPPGYQDALKTNLIAQVKQAKDFQNNIGSYSDQLYGDAQQSARKNLAQSIKQTKADFNRRGMLQSGGEVGSEYGQQAQTSAGLANTRNQINTGLQQTANNLQNNAFNTAANLAGTGVNTSGYQLQDLAQNIAQQQASTQAQQQIINSIFGAASSGAGAYFGSKGPSSPDNPGQYNPTSNISNGGYNGASVGNPNLNLSPMPSYYGVNYR